MQLAKYLLCNLDGCGAVSVQVERKTYPAIRRQQDKRGGFVVLQWVVNDKASADFGDVYHFDENGQRVDL